jgi:hypothetical protein
MPIAARGNVLTDGNEESKPTAAVGLRHVGVSRPPTDLTNGRQ